MSLVEDLDLIEAALLEYQSEYREGAPAWEAWKARFSRTWISCSERMPEPGAPVWLHLNGCRPVVRPGSFTRSGYWLETEHAGGSGWTKESATHWMPRIVDERPEPP